MGMSASQARLLSITSRLSDLEFSTQQISNSKMRLAAQSEETTSKYSNSLNQKQIQLQTGFSNGSAVYSDLSYETLTGVNSPLSAQYGLSDTRGRLLVSQDMKTKFESSNGNLDLFLTSYGAQTVYTGGDKAGYIAAKSEYDAKLAAYNQATNTTLQAESNYNNSAADAATKATTYSDALTVLSAKQSDVNLFEVTHINSSGNGSQNLVPVTYCSVSDLKDATSPNLPFQSGLNSYSTQLQGSALDLISSGYNPEMLRDLDDIAELIINCNTIDTKGTQGVAIPNSEKYDPSYWFSFNSAKAIQDAIGNYMDNPSSYNANANTIKNAVLDLLYGFDQDRLEGLRNTSFDTNSMGGSATNTPSFDYNLLSSSDKATYDALIAALTSAQTTASSAKSASDSANAQKSSDYNSWISAKGVEASALTALNAAKTALSQFVVTTPANADYYTNIFNRMQQGYVSMSDEKNTINNASWLSNQLQNGKLILEKVAGATDSSGMEVSKWKQTSWKADTTFVESYDDTQTAIVKAEYDSAMAKINNKDKKFDLELKAIDTEHNALQTEYDSVKKVIDKNIERSYKTFQG